MLFRKTFPMMCLLVAVSASASASAATPTRPEIYFRLENPCPATGQTSGACKGYVIDRILPIVCGGTDEPGNLQWQTIAAAKEKDKWERIGCRRGRKQVMPTTDSNTEAFPLQGAPEPTEVQAMPLQ